MTQSPTPTRKIPSQATSAVAHIAPEPEEDDPLLAFAPYLHARPRRNSITPDLQRQFITTLAATGIVKQAAKSIGKSLEALYKIRHRPGAEGFSAAWDEALAWGLERLEDCAMERAIHQGQYDLRANSLICFVLSYRRRDWIDARELVPGDILLFATLRNEAPRLPYFLEYYRALGVDHFLIVDNGSDDGSADLLAEADDVSLWTTEKSYRQANFGVQLDPTFIIAGIQKGYRSRIRSIIAITGA